jgi:membrane protease YdiL (CAAX protease family)
LKKLERWVERASPRFEFLVIVIVAFGYLSISSLFSLFSEPHKVFITERSLISLLLYEIAVLLILGWFLKKRGWILAQLGVIPSWKSTVVVAGLIPAVYVTYVLIWIALAVLFPEIQAINQNKALSTAGISLWTIVCASVINPVFEEIFVCGYIIHFLKKSKNLWIAVMSSTLIRTLYHLYQPIHGIVAIFSLGLVFGLFYAKTNRLWSLVVVHAIFDLYGLLNLNHN